MINKINIGLKTSKTEQTFVYEQKYDKMRNINVSHIFEQVGFNEDLPKNTIFKF